MPELPEVTTIKNDLRELVLGRQVVKVDILDDRLVRYPTPIEFAAELEGQRLIDVDRRAKYLLIRLSSGKFMVLHLIITGQFLLVEPDEPLKKSTRLILDLDDGRQLRLVDSSRLARVYLVTEEELDTHLHLDRLGPDPLGEEFTPQLLAEMIDRRKTRMKPLLLDQHFIAGIGNIYADEILHAARIHPEREARSLSPEEIQRLYEAIRSILAEAISLRGTTVRSYRDVLGRKGQYQKKLKVYGKAGKPCPDCEGNVARIFVDGRHTYFCPSCQRLPPGQGSLREFLNQDTGVS